MQASWLCFLIALFIEASLAKFCGKLGSFDALCIQEDAVFMLSTFPCRHKLEVEQMDLTIIYTKGKFQKHDLTVSKDIPTPLHYGNKDVGLMFNVHPHSGGKLKGYLHVTLSLGNFTDDGVKSRKVILDVYFYIEREGFCRSGFSGASFYPSPSCETSKRTGNFSTLCIAKESASVDKKTKGIFITAADACTVPASYIGIAIFPSKNIEVVKRFTATKTDAFVPVEKSTCGFKMKITPIGLKSSVALSYGCSDATDVQMINDYYFLGHGEVCPFTNCSSLSKRRQKCIARMITGDQHTTKINADVMLTGCSSSWHLNLTLNMESQPNALKLYFSHKDIEFADFKFDTGKQTMTEHKMPEVTNGYIPIVDGHIAIHIERLDHHDEGITEHHDEDSHDPNLTYLFIERHYGEENATEFFVSPLFTLLYSLPPCKASLSGRGSRLSGGVTALIVISVIAVFGAIAAGVYFRRRSTRNRLDGLPYQIELNYDELEKSPYNEA